MSASIWVYDIETTPNLVYTWGLWQQNVGINQIVESQDILSFAAHKIGTKGIETHAAWDGHEVMINRLHEIMDDADYLVGYNSIGFDDKLVKAQFVKAGMAPPSPHRGIDLLRVVKKHFRFPSHKLDYVCGALGLDTKVSTGGMDLWTACMAGDIKAQKKMLKYNKQDVKITTELFERLRPWIDGLNIPLYGGPEAEGHLPSTPICNKCGSDRLQSRGWAYTTTTRYRRFQCCACQGWLRSKKTEALPNNLLRNA